MKVDGTVVVYSEVKHNKNYTYLCTQAAKVGEGGNDYVAHTKCITEDEKYSAKGFVPKPNSNKGECKQQGWLEVVRGVQSQENLPKCLKTVLDSIVMFENIPRKKPKFLNFLKSNNIKLAPHDLDQLWDLLEQEHKRAKENAEISTTTSKVAETKKEDSTTDLAKDSPKQNGDLSVEVVEEFEATPKDKTKKRKRKSKDEVTDINEKEVDESLKVAEKQNESSMDVDQECEGTTKSNKTKKKKTKTGAIGRNEDQENEKLLAAVELNENFSMDVTCEATQKEKIKKKKNKKENQTDATGDIEREITENPNENTPVEVSEESGTTPKRKTEDDNKETEMVEESKQQVPEGQQEKVILTKKQKKEKKKREKYEAELKEIENSQFTNQPFENDGCGDDEQNRNKKKSKKDKDVNGLNSNVNGVTGVQSEEMSVKNKKKRHLDDDQSAEPLKKKKKKEQGDEPVEEICATECATTENTNGLQKFKWNEAILEVLRSKGGEIPVKRLRKKVVAEYQNCSGSAESEDKLIVKFNKKLSKVPGVILHKEVVKLTE